MLINRHLKVKSSFISGTILLFFAVAAYFLSFRLTAQLHYEIARKHFQNASFEAAIEYLEKAAQNQSNDDEIQRELGKAYRALGDTQSTLTAYDTYKKAAAAFSMAVRLNTLDAESVYGLAGETAKLERLNAYLNPDEGVEPYGAMPFFQEAIRLRPNGILYHYAYAHYLDRAGKTLMFLAAIENLARIYPLSYHHLKKENFWSNEVREAVKIGTVMAVGEGTDPRNVHRVLSSILAEEKDWNGAITHFKKALSNRSAGNTPENLIHLGRLQLSGGQLHEAESSFTSALLKSPTRQKDLEDVYRRYRQRGLYEAFTGLFHRVDRHLDLSTREEILMARLLFDQQRYIEAQKVLKKMIDRKASPEAFYWLARTAEMVQNWDEMELAIQKATVLDPDSSQYHLIFSQVLKRLKKLERSEREAGLAIEHAPSPSHGLFSHRAAIRLARNNLAGAIKDWEKTLGLLPKSSATHAQIAEANARLGKYDQALDHYRKAIDLDKKNGRYRERYDALKAVSRD